MSITQTPISLPIWRKRELMLMTVTNRQSGACAYRNYSYSLVAQAIELNIGVHVRNTGLVGVPTSASFFLNFVIFIFVCCARTNNTHEIVLVYIEIFVSKLLRITHTKCKWIPKVFYFVMIARSSEFPLYVMLMKITLEVQK
jgi:hypothetical protein